MNTTFLDIATSHLRCISEYTCQLMSDISNNNDDKIFKTKDIPSYGYTDKVRTDMNDIKDSVEDINTNRIAAYKTAAMNNNPVGMSLPKTDYEDDENIAKYYKDLRTVILDKFQEAATNPITGEPIGSGGQGWINFIDTLATPEERASNYKMPKFDSVYTMFVKEKHPMLRIDKKLVGCALETLMNFDKNMEALISEADEYSLDRSKKVYLHNDKLSSETFEEAVKSLAEYVLIVEEDFIMAQSLEARKHALLENVKNAHEILTALAAHNPRDIKESALCRDMYLASIRSKLDDAINNPGKIVEEKSIEESKINKCIATFKESVTKINTDTLSNYKESALQSNCIGIYINNWKTPVNIDFIIKEATDIFTTVFNEDTIKSDTIERLQETYNSIKVADKIISSGEYTESLIESISSPAVRKAIEIIPFLNTPANSIEWAFVTEGKHTVTDNDILDAIEFLEKDINNIAESLEINALSDLLDTSICNESLSKSTAKMSKRDALLENISKLKHRITTNLDYKRYAAKLGQAKVLLPQSTKVLVSASRVVSESAIGEENAKVKSFFESIDKLDKELDSTVYHRK